MGVHTWRVRTASDCGNGAWSSLTTFYYFNPSSCNQTVDHLNSDWVISSNTTISGNHININNFVLNTGVTLTVEPNCAFAVNANNITVNGVINANDAGNAGGVGGNGGYSCRRSGHNPGGSGSGAGGGGAQTSEINFQEVVIVSVYLL